MNEDANAEPIDVVSDQPITMEEATESSPEPEVQPEQKTDSVQKRMNELTAKRYEQERRAEAAEARITEMEKAQAQTIQPAQAPQRPEDTYDNEAMSQYDSDMLAHTATIAEGAVNKALENNRAQEVQNQQSAAMQQVVSTYSENALNDGVDADKLRVAGQMMYQEGLDPMLEQFILNDPHGGKITEYLYDNPVARHEVLSLDPISGGNKIINEIKALALSTTPKVSNAPEPVPDIRGGGALDKDDFDRKYPGTTFN